MTFDGDGLTVGEMYSGSYDGSCGSANLVLGLSGNVTNLRGHCGLVSCWGSRPQARLWAQGYNWLV